MLPRRLHCSIEFNHGLVVNDDAAANASVFSGGLSEPLRNKTIGRPFGYGESVTAFFKQPNDGVFQLVVFFAEDEHAKQLVDFVGRRLHGFAARGFISAAGGDAERDRCAVDRDADERFALAANHIGQHRFEIAFADAEAFDAAMTDHARRRLRGG